MLTASAGCPDPESRFDEFEARIPDARPVINIDAPMVDTIPDITGTALMALKISFVPLPIQVRIDWTLAQSGGTGTVSMMLRYLTVPQGAGDPARQPVGDPISYTVNVDNTASFVLNIPTLSIPAAANPIGSDATAENVVLSGTIKTADLTCGTMSGMVTSPLPRDFGPSTFASVRATPGATGNALPEAVIMCP